jgi:beta-N-acetylhexosaminidase
VIISDALDMAGAAEFPNPDGATGIPAAAARALAAGCDLLCLGTGGSPAQLDAIADAATGVDPARLADATARVAALVASLRGAPVAAPAFDPDPARLTAGFAIAEGATPTRDAVLVVVETTANIAVGVAPWGPAAASADVRTIRAGEPLPADLAPDAAVILVAKDVHRHPDVAALADVVRATRPGSIVVDMGWPSGPVDVATYGGSRGVGVALLHWLRTGGWRG